MTGEELRRRRTEVGMTMREVADAVGMSLDGYVKLEMGLRQVRNMRAANFMRLADALQITPQELIGNLYEKKT